ncbi:hypothetical protein AaE_003283 [Aphanomyces astaci]|nr:hypothetical protein AaE_003283 [Aphanomyces astaci]
MERILFGFHKVHSVEEAVDYNNDLETPADKDESPVVPVEVDAAPTYNSSGDYLKAMVLRLVMVGISIVLAIVWKDQFMNILDFVGASSTAMTSMILPVLFTLKTFGNKLPAYEKIWCGFVLAICSALAVYVSYHTGKALFTPETPDKEIKFPHCPAEFQKVVYTNRTYYNLP